MSDTSPLTVLHDSAGLAGGRSGLQLRAALTLLGSLFILGPAAGQSRDAMPRPPGLPDGYPSTVMLALTNIPPRQGPGGAADRIERELVRQAFLIAAREELGLPTRDAALGEIPPDQPDVRQFSFGMDMKKDGKFVRMPDGQMGFDWHLKVEIGRWQAEAYQTSDQLTLDTTSLESLEQLVADCETLSRTRCVKWLNEAGYSAAESPPPASAPDAGEPQALDATPALDVIALDQELRRLHGTRAKPDQDAARLMQLSRTYAHLGSITDFAFDLLPTVCQARALLYAERAVQAAQNAGNLANRAYVRALVGRHQAALDDFKASVAEDVTFRRPGWWALVEAYCRGNVGQVSTEGLSDSLKELKGHLDLLTQQHSATSTQQLQAAERELGENPGNILAQAIFTLHAPIGVGHVLHKSQFENTTKQWCSLLPRIAGLPDDVQKAAQQPLTTPLSQAQCRRALIDGLRSAAWRKDSSGEPSWSLLADCLEEQSVFEVWSGLNFYRFQLGVDADARLEAWRPAVAGHYLENALRAYVSNPQQAVEFLRQVPQEGIQQRARSGTLPVQQTLTAFAPSDRTSERLYVAIAATLPPLNSDLNAFYPRAINQEQRTELLRQLTQVAPFAPASLQVRIDNQWDEVRPDAQAWEERYRDVPLVQSALAWQYLQDLNDEAAERCLRRLIELAPDHNVYHTLADMYLRRGDQEKWLEVSEQALALPSMGLETATAAQRIASGLMAEGEFQKALPYAEQAARSWSGLGLLAAADCYEGLEEWEKAESFQRALSERYEPSREAWYLWCCRTNRGDRAAALRHVAPLLNREIWTAVPERRLFAAVSRQLEDDPKEAYRLYRERLKDRRTAGAGFSHLHAALLAHELKLTKDRDQWLKQSVAMTRAPSGRDFSDPLALELQAALTDPDWKLNPAVLDWLIQANSGSGYCANYAYFIGKTLLLTGHREEALRFLQLAATAPAGQQYNVVLAAHELHKLNEPVGPRRSSEYPSDIAEALKWRDESVPYQGVRRRVRLDRALQLQPDLACLWLASGNQHIAERKQPAAALKDLTRAVELAPEVPEVFIARGGLLWSFGKDAEAIRDYEQALELGSRAPQVHFELAEIRSLSSVAELRDGRKALQHAEAIAQSQLLEDWQKLMAMSSAKAENGDFEAAARLVEEARELGPETLKARLGERLKRYQANQPYRRPPPKPIRGVTDKQP